MKICQTCGDVKSTKRCLTCRRNEYYRKEGRVVEWPCITCGVKTKLASNGECASCLRIQGLKECSRCKDILSLFLGFTSKKGICKACVSLTRRPEVKKSKSSERLLRLLARVEELLRLEPGPLRGRALRQVKHLRKQVAVLRAP